jgi:hypothetical protein
MVRAFFLNQLARWTTGPANYGVSPPGVSDAAVVLPDGVSAPVVVLPVVLDVATEVDVLVFGAAAGLQPTEKVNIATAAKVMEASFAILFIKKTLRIGKVRCGVVKTHGVGTGEHSVVQQRSVQQRSVEQRIGASNSIGGITPRPSLFLIVESLLPELKEASPK